MIVAALINLIAVLVIVVALDCVADVAVNNDVEDGLATALGKY